MNRIKIKNLQKRIKINQSRLIRTVNKVLLRERINDSEISIIIVNAAGIRKLNKKYLKKDRPTDVLAFRMADGRFAQLNPQLLGDIVICADTALRVSGDMNSDFSTEISLYLTHGLLHLLGYEDKTKKGFLKMKKLQEEILKNA